MTQSPISITQLLRHAAIDPFDAQFILQHTLQLPRASVIAHPDKLIAESDAMLVRSRLERRAAGEPVAYILGEREFYGEMFKVNPAVLIPRPETEHLVEAALAHLPALSTSVAPNVLDLGTGSGAIAVTLKRLRPDVNMTATDISIEALNVAHENASNAGVAISFYRGSWYDALPPLLAIQAKFDMIVANPPYIALGDTHLSQGDLRFEPAQALSDETLGARGFAALQQIISGAPHWLKDGGYLLLEHGFDQASMAEDALFSGGFSQLIALQDLAGCDRVSGGRWNGKKGGLKNA